MMIFVFKTNIRKINTRAPTKEIKREDIKEYTKHSVHQQPIRETFPIQNCQNKNCRDNKRGLLAG